MWALICAVLLALSACLTWIALPLEGPRSGLSLPLLGNWFDEAPAGPLLVSYGTILLGLCLALPLLGFMSNHRHPALWLALGLAVWILDLIFIFRLANNLPDLAYLWDQRRQLETAVRFAKSHCDARFFLLPIGEFHWLELRLVAFPQRLLQNLGFLSWGWLLSAVAGGLIIGYGVRGMAPVRRRQQLPLIGLAALLVLVITLWKPVSLDRTLQEASDALSGGEYARANTLLDNLGRNSPEFWSWPPYLYLLGASQHRLGQDSPASHFYRGAELLYGLEVPGKKFEHVEHKKFLDEVLPAQQGRIWTEWTLATATPEVSMKKTLLHLLSWLQVSTGLRQYQSRNPETALPFWHKASSLSNRQIQANFFLGKSYLDLHMASNSLAKLNAFLDRCREPLMQSVTWALKGDAYHLMGNEAESRESYNKSLGLYAIHNYRAYKGLSGI